MQQGWICVYRSVTDHWIHKDIAWFGAWIDLLLMANHEAHKMPLDGSLITIERGQLFTSSRSLSVRWAWSKDRVNRFLGRLERDGMVLKKCDTNGTLLTIVNYSVYQDITSKSATPTRHQRDTNETPARHRRDTDATRAGRNNNENNVNNENNENNDNNETITIPLNPPSGEPRKYFPNDELLEKTFQAFIKMRRKMRKPMTEEAIDLMLKKLAKMSSDPLEQNAILEQSIREGWTGIYELKENRGNRGAAQTAEERWANIH